MRVVVWTFLMALLPVGVVQAASLDPGEGWGLSVLSFTGKPSLREQTRAEFLWNGTVFQPQFIQDGYHLGGQPCHHALTQPVQFAIRRMQEANLFDAERADFFKHVNFPDEPSQVVMFQMLRWRPNRGPNPVSPRPLDAAEIYEATETGVRTREATIWSVAAQTLDLSENARKLAHRVQWKRQRLVLESDPRLGVRLDLPASTFAWEWGRAGQTDPELVVKIGPALVFQAVREVLLLGGDLEKALVFVHTVEDRTRLGFMRNYQFRPYPGVTPLTAGDAVLYRPLKDFLNDAKFSLAKFSPKVKGLVEIARGRLSELDALKILTRLGNSTVTYWNLKPDVVAKQQTALVAYDTSVALVEQLRHTLRLFGVEDLGQAIMDFLRTQAVFLNPGEDYSENCVPPPDAFLLPDGRRENALWVSGFEEAFATAAPDELRELIAAVALGYLRRLRNYTDVPAEALFANVKWYFLTQNRLVSEKLAALGVRAQRGAFHQGFRGQLTETGFQVVSGRDEAVYFHEVTADQLVQIGAGLSPERVEELKNGAWVSLTQAQYSLRRALAP